MPSPERELPLTATAIATTRWKAARRQVVTLRIGDIALPLVVDDSVTHWFYPKYAAFVDPSPNEPSAAAISARAGRHNPIEHSAHRPQVVGLLDARDSPSQPLEANPNEATVDEVWTIDHPFLYNLSFGWRTDFGVTGGTLTYAEDSNDPKVGLVPIGLRGAIEAFFAVATVLSGGLLVHASGVDLSGLGAVFLGPSGSGKTTAARLFAHDNILNDEHVVLRPRGQNGVAMWSTPFSGELDLPRPQRVTTALIGYGLRHGDAGGASERLSPGDAFRLVLRCVVLPEGSRSLERRAFDHAGELVRRLQWRTLSFAKGDPAVAALVASELRGLS